MNRRSFLGALAASTLKAQNRPRPDTPRISLCQVGYLPKARKVVIVRPSADPPPAELLIRDIGSSRYGWHGQAAAPMRLTIPLKKTACDFGDCLTGDFAEIERPTIYQAIVGAERSTPFFVRPDAWRRTIPKAVGFIRAQRCGAEVAGVHQLCHLDDARRRDTGQHVDVTGGWHDAGDLRKLTDSGTMYGFGLLALARNLGPRWDPAASGLQPLLEEFSWGNRHFLSIQDSDGLVWNDTAGGGPELTNSDNHWTDNQPGTADDRFINVAKLPLTQGIFVALEAMAATVFRPTDPRYADRCQAAAVRCFEASRKLPPPASRAPWGGSLTRDLAWRVRAALELHRATGRESWAAEAVRLASELADLQHTGFIGSQKRVRGFWRIAPGDQAPYTDPVDSSLPPLVFLELAEALPKHADSPRWRDAVRLYLDEYLVPMTARSAYRIAPFGVFLGSPTPERYRPLEGELTYRYFMPTKKWDWWFGMSSHLTSHALLLALAARVFSKLAYRELGTRQLEWIMGANPFSVCQMSGEGLRNPYPHSRFVGPITGGILNGIAGDHEDQPIFDTETHYDYRTTEYWAPHNGYYLWALSVLEA